MTIYPFNAEATGVTGHCIAISLPTDASWYLKLIDIVKRYGHQYQMGDLVVAAFDRMLNPNENSEITDLIYEDLYETFQYKNQLQDMDDETSQSLLEFGETVVDLLIHMDTHVKPYALSFQLANESYIFTPHLKFCNEYTCALIYVDGGVLCKKTLYNTDWSSL